MALPFFTVGHSNLARTAFIELLHGPRVARVVDVRAFPRSRTNPQFNIETLPEALDAAGIGYEHVAALGGRRSRATDVPADVNGLWDNASFHNYADYALSAPFHAGLAHLLEIGHAARCAIMCSEALWWRCHRRIVADHLLARGETVFHLMGNGALEPAQLTRGAVVLADKMVVYPALEQTER